MTPWVFILAVLALWRICRLIVYEDGPFFILLRLRTWAGIDETEDEVRVSNWPAMVLTCPLCLSVWLAIPLVIVLHGSWLEWLAVSGGSSILTLLVDKNTSS